MTETAQINATNAASYLLERESEFLLRSRMLSLRSLTEFMANMRGRRKSIIYVTTGLGASVYEALDYDGGIRSIAIEDLHAAITAATRGNVSIYPMDPGGIVPGRDVTEIAAANPDNTVPEPSGTALGRMQDLRALAETTGGFAIVNTNSFNDGFTRVVRENSSYYILGFSTTPQTDGRFHSVEIRVKRPGLQVRSRGGYLAPLRRKTPSITRASTLAPAIVDALQSPIGVAGVPIRLFAAPYKGSDQQAKVAIAAEFGVEALNLTERSGRFTGTLAVALRPTSAEGKLLEGQRQDDTGVQAGDIRGHQEAGRPGGDRDVASAREVSASRRRRADRWHRRERDLRPRHPELHKGAARDERRRADLVHGGGNRYRVAERGEATGYAPSIAHHRHANSGRRRLSPSTPRCTRMAGVRRTIDFRVDLSSATGRVMSTFTAQQPSTSGNAGTYSFIARSGSRASIPAHMCSAWRQRQPQARRRRSHGKFRSECDNETAWLPP